jgi:hypothetical protein
MTTTIKGMQKKQMQACTDAQIAWRKADRAAREQAIAETAAKFPQITTQNLIEASDFQERRIKEIMKQIPMRADG